MRLVSGLGTMRHCGITMVSECVKMDEHWDDEELRQG